jgi:hypothetical protein
MKNKGTYDKEEKGSKNSIKRNNGTYDRCNYSGYTDEHYRKMTNNFIENLSGAKLVKVYTFSKRLYEG